MYGYRNGHLGRLRLLQITLNDGVEALRLLKEITRFSSVSVYTSELSCASVKDVKVRPLLLMDPNVSEARGIHLYEMSNVLLFVVGVITIILILILILVIIIIIIIIFFFFTRGTLDPSGFTKIIRRLYSKMHSGMAKTRQDPAA